MRSIQLLVIFLFLHATLYAQIENSHWCFGWNAHVIFNSTPPNVGTAAITLGHPGDSDQGASVSNAAGQLLFYTDGINVWDNTHTLMPNGSNLYGYTDVP